MTRRDDAARRRDDTEHVISGSHGDDVLDGTPESDFIHGKSGDDTVYGNGGNDVISAGNGNDLIWGGAGNDVFIITQGARRSHDTIFDWNSGDVIDVQSYGTYTVTQNGDDVLVILSGGPVIDVLGVNVSDIAIV